MPTSSGMATPPDSVLLSKASIIERSLNRMREEYSLDPRLQSFTHIDAMTLNIERACQAAIDAAQHLVARHHCGVPQSSAESFDLLRKAGLLSSATAKAMIGMTGFRNVAIQQYQELDKEVLRAIAEGEYLSLVTFYRELGIRITVAQ